MLFLVVMDFVMKKSTDHVGVGIPCTDHDRLADLDFANNVALLAEDDPQLQVATTHLTQEAAKTGLRKIEVHAGRPSRPNGVCDCQQLTP